MPKSYRIRTEPGVDKQIRVNIEQDFDFLEILSLKIRQDELYSDFCANYGVVVGRVIANGGYGVPNARVSIFVPIDQLDINDPVINTLYPYRTLDDINEDGYRYNLLPYTPSYNGHVPTGTFPNREDVLTDKAVLQIYEKYYRFVVRTNDSGDFMIVGVPLGVQTITMDLDLSDIGCFSLRPTDLVRQGRGVQSQFDGNRFRASNDLGSLPQIVTAASQIDVASFWGQQDLCNIGITRNDFDLRSLGIEIQPTAVFMGSIMTSNQQLKKSCKPKTEMGDLCGMSAGPGQIIAIRQTIFQDSNGDPVLEELKLENGGKVIDENGAWVVDVPMNLDYVVTNEFGEQVFSNDPSVGIPTSAKYRFKVKWQDDDGMKEVPVSTIPLPSVFTTPTGELKRANFLVPNIREYGWTSTSTDPASLSPTSQYYKELKKSYAFSLDWADYVDKQAAINCEDFFYKFKYNKVYTVSQLIDEYRNGTGRGRFIGIKEIIDRTCETEVNRFPTNDGVRNFDTFYFIFNFLLSLLTVPFFVIIILYHVLSFLWEWVRIPLLLALSAVFTAAGVSSLVQAVTAFSALSIGAGIGFIIQSVLWFGMTTLIFVFWNRLQKIVFYAIPLPNITYPDCQICECEAKLCCGDEELETYNGNTSFLANVNQPAFFSGLLAVEDDETDTRWMGKFADGFLISMAGNNINWGLNGTGTNPASDYAKAPFISNADNPQSKWDIWSYDLPLAERMNLFNLKSKFHRDGDNGSGNAYNQIQVKIRPGLNPTPYFDNLLVMLADPGTLLKMEPAQLISFSNPKNSLDPNITGHTSVVNSSGFTITNGFNTFSTTGTSSLNTSIQITHMSPTTLLPVTQTYVGITGSSTVREYQYPADIEYFQLVTGHTLGDYITLCGQTPASISGSTYPALGAGTLLRRYIFGFQRIEKDNGSSDLPNEYPDNSGNNRFTLNVPNIMLNSDYLTHEVLFMVRGVDPHCDKQIVQYDLSKLYGSTTFGSKIVQGDYHLNNPTTPYSTSTDWRIPRHNDISNNASTSINRRIFFPYFNFTPDAPGTTWGLFTGWTTQNHLNYSSYDLINTSYVGNGNLEPAYSNSAVQNINSTPATLTTYSNTDYKRMINIGDAKEGFENGYYRGEILEGGSYMVPKDRDDWVFFSPVYYQESPNHTISFTDTTYLVMRTDRLPTSDIHQARFSLHQNGVFQAYIIENEVAITSEYNVGSDPFSDGSDDFADDNGGAGTTVLNTFSCGGMVPLDCYSGNGLNFSVKPSTDDCYYVGDTQLTKLDNGCYYLVQKRFAFATDFQIFAEWKARFRLNYALCRNVVSLTFVNNWVNGSLFMYTFQNDKIYNQSPTATTFNTRPEYIYCDDLIFYQDDTNSFFYRSSPYNSGGTGNFIGRNAPNYAVNGGNVLNLGQPTTIMDLGPRDEFTKEICFSPDFQGFVVDKIASTSYNDTSDLLQTYLISRIVNAKFWDQVLQRGDASIAQLFSRPKNKLDGDIVQLNSINSEFGVTPYLGSNYGDSQINFLSGTTGPVVGVFFSANTVSRDLITPGRTTFIDTTSQYKTDNYGIVSQEIPYFEWEIKTTSPNPYIFGTELNDWKTNVILSAKYQSFDRRLNGYYFESSQTAPTTQRPGFIYNSSPSYSGPTLTGFTSNPNFPVGAQKNVLVGAPFHFYFGLKKGKSAMNKYVERYIFSE